MNIQTESTPNSSSLKLDDGSKVQISKCPNNHGKIKSPVCCGQDMTCSVN